MRSFLIASVLLVAIGVRTALREHMRKEKNHRICKEVNSMTCGPLRWTMVSLLVSALLGGSAFTQATQPAPNLPEDSTLSTLSSGTVAGNIYTNRDLSLRYEFPPGWVVNDKAAQKRAIAGLRQYVWAGDSDLRDVRAKGGLHCTKDLLLVTQYPEDMDVEDFHVSGVNLMALVLAADPRCAPGVAFPSNAKDDRAVQRVVSNLGIYVKTAPLMSPSQLRIRVHEDKGRVVLEVSRALIVSMHERGMSMFRIVYTSVFVTQVDKYWVMWMFAGGDEGPMAKLKATKMFFEGAK